MESLPWAELNAPADAWIGRYIEVDKSLFPRHPASSSPRETRELHYTDIFHLIGNVEEWVGVGGGKYAACGGSFHGSLERIDVTKKPSASSFVERDAAGNPRTGFRLVFDLGEDHRDAEARDFLRHAQE
jgi:hypothetical protein